ncbi:pirin family protein [Shouchella rhizosphaerae]|uniref:pirin family protein n=1 Tax=Shouchella rhizosphaerae TaxID=866786 RepID=UPI003F7FFE79
MEAQIARTIREHWYVQYRQNGYPHVQQGWVLPPGREQDFDPFVVMADDWFKRGTFSDHPHRGFQTITYVIDGRLEHSDNHGGYSILDAGDVQYMNAGYAARHAEEAFADDVIHTLQLWVNLPKALKRSPASYQDVRLEEAPVVEIDGGSLRVYSGETAGVTGPLRSAVPVQMVELSLQAGAEYDLTLPAQDNGHLYVLQGELAFGPEANEVVLGKTGVGLFNCPNETGQTESVLRVRALQRSKVLVYSGKPLREQVVAHGPFVMNTIEEIEEAYADFRAGKFGPPSQ